jgi:hypothetical protein
MIRFFVLDDEGLEWRVQQLKCYEQLVVYETSVLLVGCSIFVLLSKRRIKVGFTLN